VVRGKVVCRPQAPEYTGYESALYAVVAIALGIDEDDLEKWLFAPIDSDAAFTLAKIETREPINGDDKHAWAFFLNSLRVRQPDVLAHLRTEGMTMMKCFLAEGDAALPEGWPSTEQWVEDHHPGMLETQSLISWLSRIVLHDETTERFENLHWWVKEFKPEAPKQLLSDLPIHWEGGLSTGTFFIQMPIAPDRIFFGTEDAETEAYLSEMSGAELIRRVNRGTLASSSNRIWGIDAQGGRACVHRRQSRHRRRQCGAVRRHSHALLGEESRGGRKGSRGGIAGRGRGGCPQAGTGLYLRWRSDQAPPGLGCCAVTIPSAGAWGREMFLQSPLGQRHCHHNAGFA